MAYVNRLTLWTFPALLLALVVGLHGSSAEAYPPPVDGLRVYDLTGQLPDTTRRDTLNRELLAFEATHPGTHVAVLTVPDTDGDPLADYAHGVTHHWNLGEHGLNKSVLLLVTRTRDPNGHTRRIDVGEGLTGKLSDADCRRILEDVIRPLELVGNRQGALEAGTRAILRELGSRGPQGPLGGQRVAILRGGTGPNWPVLIGVIVVIGLGIALLRFLVNRRKDPGGRRLQSLSGGDSDWGETAGELVDAVKETLSGGGGGGGGGWDDD